MNKLKIMLARIFGKAIIAMDDRGDLSLYFRLFNKDYEVAYSVDDSEQTYAI